MAKRHNSRYDPALDSTQHLLWLGTQSSSLNQMAREALASRGESSLFLREYEKCFQGGGAWKYEGDLPPRTWTAVISLGLCCDCRKPTYRTYNGGHIFQCGTCADGVKSVGRKAWREQLAAKKRRLLKKTTPEPEQTKTIEPTEIIPAREPSYREALKEGADPAEIKAAGNREAAQAGMEAYTQTKNALMKAITVERAA